MLMFLKAALDLGKRNLELNGLSDRNVSFVKEDVFKLLRRYREEKAPF